MTLLKKKKPSLLDRLGPLPDALDPLTEELPRAWNGPHVSLRLVEAFNTLKLMPMRDRKGLRAVWPQYMYEFSDLAAQAEGFELEKTQAKQNRVRITPSAAAISQMEEALWWPAKHLAAKHELREAVNTIALAHSLDLDAGWVAKKRGGYADTWRERHDVGCELIARSLQRDRVQVF
jgi:hypothetical protein